MLHAIHCTIARCPLVLDTLSFHYLYYARRTRGFGAFDTLQSPLYELYRIWELSPLKLAMEAVGSSDGQTTTMKFSKETFDLESNTRFEYDPWLLDDHPLRSYPTECIPGLSLYLDEYYQSIGKRRAILFRAACLIFGCL